MKQIYICHDPKCLMHSHPSDDGPAIFIDDGQVPLSQYRQAVAEIQAYLSRALEALPEPPK